MITAILTWAYETSDFELDVTGYKEKPMAEKKLCWPDVSLVSIYV
jgi:hypothetical protein